MCAHVPHMHVDVREQLCTVVFPSSCNVCQHSGGPEPVGWIHTRTHTHTWTHKQTWTRTRAHTYIHGSRILPGSWEPSIHSVLEAGCLSSLSSPTMPVSLRHGPTPKGVQSIELGASPVAVWCRSHQTLVHHESLKRWFWYQRRNWQQQVTGQVDWAARRKAKQARVD